MKKEEEKILIEKSNNYGRKEAKMTLFQIKEKYFPNRKLNDLRNVKEEKSLKDFIEENMKKTSCGI
jgi:hypothetical protein